MKKVLIFLLTALAVSRVFAQTAAETTGVSGKLALVNGRIALESGSDVYYVAGIGRLIGFVDGLKEGADVTVEGYIRPSLRDKNTKVLLAVKLSLGGRSYNLGPGLEKRPGNFAGPAPWRNTPMMRGMPCQPGLYWAPPPGASPWGWPPSRGPAPDMRRER
ncbi:MAG: hypothetical protein LBD31_05170 [Treponema sp.]|jgi:hypothetical protein|nr:hypothetical protein [Treponema sp.]